jgi:prephenate dehydratase/chorismate mutase/prephenate dehydratase
MNVIKCGYLGPEGTFTHQAAQQLLSFPGLFSDSDGEARNNTELSHIERSHIELWPFANVGEIFRALELNEIQYGVAAIDNSVEGPVFATIDGLLQSSDVVAVAEVVLPIQFDAYALAGPEVVVGPEVLAGSEVLAGPEVVVETEALAGFESDSSGAASGSANYQSSAPARVYRVGVAHPHALAQVTQALKRFGVQPQAASSNGAALANLAPGQIAFGPPGYTAPNVITLAENVGDYPEAQTQFVLLTPRTSARNSSSCEATLAPPGRGMVAVGDGSESGVPSPGGVLGFQDSARPAAGVLGFRDGARPADASSVIGSSGASLGVTGGDRAWQCLLAITPGVTGPGVLARITEQFARRELNLSALISRPIKGKAGKYVFIVTVDAAPWQPPMRALLADLLAAEDAVKTLGVWQKSTSAEPQTVAPQDGIPPGSAQGRDPASTLEQSLLW